MPCDGLSCEEHFVAGSTENTDWTRLLRSDHSEAAHVCRKCAVVMDMNSYTEAMNVSYFQHRCRCALSVWVCRPCFRTMFAQRGVFLQ